MKRILTISLLLIFVLSLSACKKNTEDKASSSKVSSTTSEISTEKLFGNNGTESEYKITESETESLFQSQKDREEQESKNESNQSSTSDKETSSKKGTTSKTETTSKVASTTSKDTVASATNNSKFDADGDGWTDGWK